MHVSPKQNGSFLSTFMATFMGLTLSFFLLLLVFPPCVEVGPSFTSRFSLSLSVSAPSIDTALEQEMLLLPTTDREDKMELGSLRRPQEGTRDHMAREKRG